MTQLDNLHKKIDSDDCHLAGQVEGPTLSVTVHREFLLTRGQRFFRSVTTVTGPFRVASFGSVPVSALHS